MRRARWCRRLRRPEKHAARRTLAADDKGVGVDAEYAALNNEDFRRLVATDARNQSTPDAAAFLRSGPNLQRWSDALHELNKDLEAQFMERKADAQVFQNACFAAGPEGKREWFEYKAQYDQWRAGARRFHAGIQAKIKENKTLMREHATENDRERYRSLLKELVGFLDTDEAITYKYVPERDRLREQIERTLYGT